MYSLILMAAMTSSPEAASFGWRTGCQGCVGAPVVVLSGCSGFLPAGCVGSSCQGAVVATGCTGCSGVVATGCCGGGPLFPRVNACFNRLTTPVFRLGCYGSSCYGNSCSGYSCHGGFAYSNSACYGSGAGCCGGFAPVSSVYGGCYGSGYSMPTYSTGCVGSVIEHHSVPAVISETPAVPEPKPMTPAGEAKPKTEEKPKADKPQTSAAAPANLAIRLPANATLYVDGQLIEGQGDLRHFHTPALQAGKTYFYEFKAVFTVGNETQVEEQRVIVRAGEQKTQPFEKLLAAAKAVNQPTLVSR